MISGYHHDAAAQTGNGVPSDECCLTLTYTVGARALALGQAITARTDASAYFVNPALLGGLVDDEFLIHNAPTSIDKATTFTLIITSAVAGNFALGYRLIDLGEQEALNGPGQPVGTLSTIEHVLTASYATHVSAGLSAGVSYELYQSRAICQGFCATGNLISTTHAIALGLQFRPSPLPALDLGASLIHLGFPLQAINAEQADPTPARVRIGVAYEILHHFQADSTTHLHLSADLVDRWRGPGDVELDVGAELSFQRTIFLRAGYAGGAGLSSGGAVGVGVNYDRFDVGVATSFVSTAADESPPYQITFGIRF
jgi:hypothetical protein